MTYRLLPTAVGFALILNLQFAGISLGYLPETALLITGALLVWKLWRRFGLHPVRAVSFLTCTRESGVFLWAASLFYLAVDLSGLIRADSLSLAWEKYRVTAALLIAAAALCTCREEKNLFRICAAVSAAGGFLIAGGCVFNTLLFSFQPVEYTRRLSLRADYNLFAAALLFFFLCAVFGAMCAGRPCLCFWTVCTGMLPVLWLAASRRVWILLPAVLPTVGLSFLFVLRKRYGRRGVLKGLVCCAVAVISVWFSVEGLSLWMKTYTDGGAPAGRMETAGTATVEQRMESIASSTVFTKRFVIWSIAAEEFASYPPLQKLFGRGAFSDIRLYDDPRFDERLDAVYPVREERFKRLSAHSCLLADLLNGGIFKTLSLLVLIGAEMVACLKLLFKKPLLGLPLSIILGITLLNNLVSNRYGLLYDRWFWLGTAAAAAALAGKEDAS